jgi:hypothetical protein
MSLETVIACEVSALETEICKVAKKNNIPESKIDEVEHLLFLYNLYPNTTNCVITRFKEPDYSIINPYEPAPAQHQWFEDTLEEIMITLNTTSLHILIDD